MTSAMTHINDILALSLKDIVVGQNTSKCTLDGGGVASIADRIAELSVPTGLVYIPEMSSHKLEYRSTAPYYTYETISEELYDKLLDLVSVNGKSQKPNSKSRKPKVKGGKTTRRNT